MIPERVADKRASVGAYLIGGEYVIDIDPYLNNKKRVRSELSYGYPN
jgi:hypothetical protein